MALLKDLKQLNEAFTPGKFYVVLIQNNEHIQDGLSSSIFSLFGYIEIGTADDFLSEEQKENFSNHPAFEDFKVFAKRGLTAESFKNDSELTHALWKDIDGHDYIDIN